MTAGALKPCLGLLPDGSQCGELTEHSRCPEHRPKDRRKRQRPSATRRGYDASWQRLSRTARSRQRFCTDCGIPDTATPLELDHLSSAWQRKAEGLPIRLGIDVEVVCHRCNVKRGAARGAHISRTI